MKFFSFINAGLIAFIFFILSAAILFIERKFIGIAQRRIGITFLGRNGWIHLPADIIKFWFKSSNRHLSIWYSLTSNSFLMLVLYFFWNLLGCIFLTNNNDLSSSDSFVFSIFFYLFFASITTLYLFFITVSMRSKYAILGSLRLLITCISLEFSFIFSYMYLIFYSGGYSFDSFLNFINIPFPILFPAICLIFFLYSLFESKRAPFDHAEAESELIAGHIVEFSGKSLLLFYFSEYMHLLFIIFLIKIICFGLTDDENFSLLNIFFFNYNFQKHNIIVFDGMYILL